MQNDRRNPDVNTPNIADDERNQSNDYDIERPSPTSEEDKIPVPSDEPSPAPIEEPPGTRDKPSIDEDSTEPKRIV